MSNLEEENAKLKELISNFKDIKMEFITKGGKAKMISWGEDYKKWDVEKRLEYAESLASAMNDACDLIQKERNVLLEQNKVLIEKLVASEQAIQNHKTININMITQANSDKQELIKELRSLEKQLKFATNGAFNQN